MPKSKISFCFMGTDAFAEAILFRLIDDPLYEALGVVIPPDARVGRTQSLIPCPVKSFALERNLPIFYSPEDLIDRAMDFLIVASYGKLLSQLILDLPRYASLNVHGSLLPLYRGASPIHAALLNGDRVTGVTIMKMVQRLDAGPICAFSEWAIRLDHTEATLRSELASLGAELLAQTLFGLVDGSIECKNQDESQATYCAKLNRQSGQIEWSHDSAQSLFYKWQAYTPWPGLFTFFNGKRLKILGAKLIESSDFKFSEAKVLPGEVIPLNSGRAGVITRQGVLEFTHLQLEGKKALPISNFLRGHPHFLNAHLG